MTTTNIIKSMGASDIDTKELTANLVAATKAPRQKLIDAEKTKADVAISNIALLKNGLSSLQQAATAIASSSKLRASQVTSSDSTVVRASQLSTTTAKTGDYSLEVDALAAPRRLKSTAMASGTWRLSGLIEHVLIHRGAVAQIFKRERSRSAYEQRRISTAAR